MKPFTIQVESSVLQDLTDRLARIRWPDEVENARWDYGTNRAYLQELVEYWRTEFDWRRQERLINELPQYVVTIDGLDVHSFTSAAREPGRFL